MRRLRVLALAPTFPPVVGGLELVAQRVVSHLPDMDCTVLALEPPADAPPAADGSLDVRRLDGCRVGDRRSLTRYNAWVVARAVRRRPDVLLSFHVTGSVGAIALARLLRVPLVQYVHAKEFGRFARLTREAIRAASAVIAVSSYTAGLAIEAGARPRRLHRILNGVDLPDSPSAARTGPPTIVTVSRLDDRYKGHDVVIDALSQVRPTVPDVRWIVVGDGALLPELRRHAERLGLSGAVAFAGRVGDAERDAILDRAHAFVMPSRVPPGGAGGEGFGIALLEANAHGLPVIAGRAGGVGDAVADGRTAVLVDAEDPRAVASAITSLLRDEPRRRALGEEGIRHARSFTWSSVAAQVADVLRDAARRS
jgi:phosphatidylinositol alpha-1,6-mannosyltransferase